MKKPLLTLLLWACAATSMAAGPRLETVARGLEHPWGLAFIGEDRFLVTERPGRLRVVGADGRIGEPIAGLPKIDAGSQGGLLDVVADSGFAKNRSVYFCFSEPAENGRANSTALASARLSQDERTLGDLKILFSQKPKVASRMHFGCRIAESADHRFLFLTLGDRFSRKEDAQTLDNHLGKTVRILKDGSVPADNPFVKRAGALPEIWSHGHRNSQGATIGPDGHLWMIEHGPQGGDELNRPEPGQNHGWPVITYGENYGGGAIGEGITAKAGMVQPLHYWVPSIAPSGMAFVNSPRYPKDWQGHLLIGSLKFGYVARLVLQGGKVQREEKLIEVRARVRDVRQGPDGFVYLLTDAGNGALLRLRSD